MRLTLRTLLAYLDDILEPAQAKEIGTKIAESDAASSLSGRIREVMRRRRLTAPDLEGPGSGLDPNMVAEYLDNVLPPEKVADVERICLESDVHLAEMAASHQILTAALGEPVQILHESREHMYALGPIGPGNGTQQARAPVASAADVAASAATMPPSAKEQPPAGYSSNGSGNEFEDTIPEFLRQKPIWKRALPYTLVGLIAVVWIGLLWMGGNLSDDTTDRPSADSTLKDVNLDAMTASNRQTDDTVPQADGVGDQSEPFVPAVPMGDDSIDPIPPGDAVANNLPIVDPQPPEDLNLPAVPAPAPAVTQPPADHVAANATTVKPEVVPVPAVAPMPEVVPAVAAPKLQYNSSSGILLRYDHIIEDWMVMAPRAFLHGGEKFVAPEPYEAVINIGNGLARATLAGGTSVQILPPTKAAVIGFGIEQGQLILEGVDKPSEAGEQPAEPKPVELSISVRGELWRLELLSPDTVCGVEIAPVQPNQPEQDLTGNTYAGRLYVVSGSVRFADGTGKVQLLTGPSWRSLTPADRAGEEDPPAAVPPLLKIPSWLNPVSRQSMARATRRAATLFEREFDAERPLSENVHPLIKDDRPYVSELAVKCLALTGKYNAVADGLNAAHEEARRAAIEGIRNWLGQEKENGDRLTRALEARFPVEEAEIIQRLLWGYNDQDAMNRATSVQLVEWLNHSNLIIRELAFYHIYRLTGTKYDYVAMRPEAQRRAAVMRWEDRIRPKSEGGEGALIAPAGN